MSENIEFISAADLPSTEATEVDVLCIENGELKKKSGANLGGGGADNYDAIIRWTEEDNDGDGWCDDGTRMLTFESGSYESLKKILDSGKVPKIKIYGTIYYNIPGDFMVESSTCIIFNAPEMGGDILQLEFLMGMYFPVQIAITPNDEILCNL